MQTARRNDLEGAISPVTMVVGTSDSTESALAAMDATGRDFVPVVDAAGEFTGIVLRRGVERGCRAMGHRPEHCMVLNHLKRGVRSANIQDAAHFQTGNSASSEPVILLGEQGEPVGILDPLR